MRSKLRSVDMGILGLVLGLIVFGLVVLTSASTPVGYERFQDLYWFVKHQMFYGLVPGLIGMFVMSRIPYHIWKKFSVLFLGLSIVLLILVFIPGLGAEFGTARSWISLGFFSFQPAEIVKLTFLLYLAGWLEGRREMLQDVSAGLLPFLLALGSVCLLIILQPDVGTMTVIAVIALAAYFAAGAPWAHLAGLASIGAVLLTLLIKFAPYRAQRFMTFLHPELDPQGIGYHINQALLAIGSGGVFGLGYGYSRQKFQYLPEVVGDSIFAVMAEELGLLVSVLVIGLFLALAHRMLKLATRVPDDFGRYVVVGVTTWICFQAFVNIAAMLSLMPMTGIPLPFISYGGTSVVVLLSAIGIVLNISKYAE